MYLELIPRVVNPGLKLANAFGVFQTEPLLNSRHVFNAEITEVRREPETKLRHQGNFGSGATLLPHYRNFRPLRVADHVMIHCAPHAPASRSGKFKGEVSHPSLAQGDAFGELKWEDHHG